VNGRRVRMWKADPRCHWCGIATVLERLPNGRVRKNLATIDHLYPRHHPERQVGAHEVVLACYGCNERRNRADWKARPVEEKRLLAERMRAIRVSRREKLQTRQPILVSTWL
jgi:hypothetical protein